MARASKPAAASAVDRLAAIVQSSDDAIIGKTLDGTITDWNEGATRMYGYKASEAVGRNIAFLAPKDYKSEIPEILRQIKSGKRVVHHETSRKRKDKRLLTVSLTISPIKDAKGRIVGAATIARDVTESRRAEERFRLVVEAAPSAIVMVAKDGRIVLVNSQAERLFGYPRTELIGEKIEILIPERFHGRHKGFRDEYFSRPNARPMGAGRDLFGRRKDGSEVPIEIGLNPMQTPDGPFVLASIIDITNRRELERKVMHSEALAAVGSMVTVVSHEIRNPLGSIVMAAKALARGGLSTDDHERVMKILVDESQRLNRTMNDFLNFARPRHPKLEHGDLNSTVREVLTAARSDKSLTGEIDVEESLDEGVPHLAFDHDQLRQVLWNVLRNAYQAMAGRGTLRIETKVEGASAVVAVEDSGPGISPQQLDRLFTPFHTTKTQGTGLGLPISLNIIRAHGGDILVESRPGKGARFTILLPIGGKRP